MTPTNGGTPKAVDRYPLAAVLLTDGAGCFREDGEEYVEAYPAAEIDWR